MTEQSNIDVIKQIYAAYGQGNVPGILALMADDVVHDEPPAGAPPYRGRFEGHDGVRHFFQSAFEAITVQQFDLREFVATGDTVVALGHYRFLAKATQRAYDTDWAMVWRLKDGKVVEWTTHKDSAAEAAALS
jgi:ketosteroid isomerase-like protein